MSENRNQAQQGIVTVTVSEDQPISAGPAAKPSILSALEAQIAGVIAGATIPPTQPAAPGEMAAAQCCEACGQAMGWDPSTAMPEKCGACGGRVWIGDTIDQARARAETAKGAAKATEKPSRKPRAPRIEPPKVVTAIVVDEATETSMVQVSAGPMDLEARKAATAKARASMVAKYALNNIEFKPVGEGVVWGIGFTLWEDGKPQPVTQEPIESEFDFMRVYREQRIIHPGIRFDVACIQSLSEDIKACSFRGQINASLVQRDDLIRVKRDEKVKLAAKISGTGTLIWAVVKP